MDFVCCLIKKAVHCGAFKRNKAEGVTLCFNFQIIVSQRRTLWVTAFYPFCSGMLLETFFFLNKKRIGVGMTC